MLIVEVYLSYALNRIAEEFHTHRRRLGASPAVREKALEKRREKIYYAAAPRELAGHINAVEPFKALIKKPLFKKFGLYRLIGEKPQGIVIAGGLRNRLAKRLNRGVNNHRAAGLAYLRNGLKPRGGNLIQCPA
jgi:hypothetical protein